MDLKILLWNVLIFRFLYLDGLLFFGGCFVAIFLVIARGFWGFLWVRLGGFFILMLEN